MWVLRPDQAVGDVHARLLQRRAHSMLRGLVEAGLELHERRDLLAPLGRADQRLDDGAVAGGAVQRQLDGEHLGVRDACRTNSSTDVANES